MDNFNTNKFFQITENLKTISNGGVDYGDKEVPDWNALMQTGRFCRIYGFYDDAIWCYNQAFNLTDYLEVPLEGKPRLKSSVLSAKAMCLSSMGNNNEAIKECDLAIQLNFENYEAYHNKGIALFNTDRYQESIVEHKIAISLNSKYSLAYNAIGRILVDKINDYANALIYLDKAIELSEGQDTNAWINKGNALSHLGKLDEAYLCWDTAYEISPENNAHAMLNKAMWLFKAQNKKTESLNLLNQVKARIGVENNFYNQVNQLYTKISNDQ